MHNQILYLASQSRARQLLLRWAGIPVVIITHAADERAIPMPKTADQYAIDIALAKMQHAQLPTSIGQNTAFVIAADTIIQLPRTGTLLGKPKDIDDARSMHQQIAQGPISVITGCVIAQKRYVHDQWITEQQHAWSNNTTVEFYIPENEFDAYIQRVPEALHAAGASIIEEYGTTYLKSINGSYSSVMGLPLFEVRAVLKEMGFSY